MIKEIRKISAGEIRHLCVRYCWFTCGDNEEYAKLMEYSEKENITTQDLEEMAEMIIKYSEEVYLDERQKVDIMFTLNDICTTIFVEE